MRILKRLLRYALILALAGILLGAAAIGVAYWLISPRLPSVASLKDVRMQVPLRVLSADGKLIATFGETRRIPVHIEDVPARMKNAVLAAEDSNFYHHPGVDWQGTLRAAYRVIMSGGDKTQGGSTITQQVARNFFLSPQKTYTRKLTEMFTAFRIEHELSKDQILELYLNKMFLGHRSYGIGAAAQYYYGKTVQQLTLGECALLASSFQLPSVVNPLSHPERALARRNWVLGQMLSNRFITRTQYEQAIAEPNNAFPHEPPIEVEAPYLAEMVRLQALQRLGNAALTGGYVVRTTIDSRLQRDADHAVRAHLVEYDHRHGYRGPEAHVELPPDAGTEAFDEALAAYDDVSGMVPGIVAASDATQATVYLADRDSATLDMDAVAWARPYVNASRAGAKPRSVDAVLKRGDIVRMALDKEGKWQLTQIPAAQAALVSLDPEDGAVKALVGGFNFVRSKFNRALMSGSGRQPGSSFKPYLYAAALAHGFTPSSIINDAPVSFPDPSRPNGIWSPSNDDGKFDGPMRLREALVKSKNLVSVRLLNALGLRVAREYITRFGFSLDQLPQNLSLALGTASVSPMSMARGYAVLANGGFLVDPYFIAQIDDRNGKPIFVAEPPRACRNCEARLLDNPDVVDNVPEQQPAEATTAPLPDALVPVAAGSTGTAPAETAAPRLAPRAIDVRTDYLIVSMMRDVVRRGTGSAARALGRDDLAGKTGSTNDHRDAWFSGFDANLVATVWVGFDDFSSLGRGEFGAKAALPIWMGYMGAALKDKPSATLPMPPGIATVAINRYSGLPTGSDDPNAMQEIFKVEDVSRLREAARQQQENKDQQHAFDIF